MIEVHAYAQRNGRLEGLLFAESGREFSAVYDGESDDPASVVSLARPENAGIEGAMLKGRFTPVDPPVEVPSLRNSEAYPALYAELMDRFNTAE